MPKTRRNKLSSLYDVRNRNYRHFLDNVQNRKRSHEEYMQRLKNVTAQSLDEISMDAGEVVGIFNTYNIDGSITNVINNGLGYAIPFGCPSFNPAASTTYYFGMHFSQVPSTTENQNRIGFPRVGQIISVITNFSYVGGVTPNPDFSTVQATLYLRMHNSGTTDITVAALFSSVSNTGIIEDLDIAYPTASIIENTGNFFEMKLVTPAWTTPPTLVRIDGLVYIEPIVT